jgi:hypothetical protein
MKFRLASVQINTPLPGGKTNVENRISIGVVKKIKNGLITLFHGMPATQARQERAEVTTGKIEAYDQFVEFLKTADYSEDEIKSIITQILISESSDDNPVKHLKVISDLVERKRINFQINLITTKASHERTLSL